MGDTTEWLLFVDESGAFQDAADRVCVAGFLVREQEKALNAKAMRALLDSAFPEIPYPQHAADLNRPGFHLANWLVRSRPRLGADLDASLGRLASALNGLQGAAADRARSAIAAGEIPRYEDLRDLEPPLRAATPRDFEVLRALVERARDAMVGVVHRLGVAYPPGHVFALAAAETTSPLGEPHARDRYLHLLQILLERVLALFRTSPPERHKVWVRAAERKVRLPSGLELHLRASDVTDCVRMAELEAPLAPQRPPDPYVRLVAMQPPRFDAEVHPGIVFADFIANLSRGPLGKAPSLKRLTQSIEFRGGVPVAAPPRMRPERPMPTPAASGKPRRAISDAFRGAPTGKLADVRPGWASEQAAEWIDLALEVRR